jgi:maltose-binding protein MalE
LVDVSNLTPEQAAALAARLAPTVSYVAASTERMDATHWRPNDPAYEAAWRCRKELEEMIAALTDPDRPLKPPPKPWERGGRGWDKGA